MEDLKKRLHYPSRDIQLAAANKIFMHISSTKKVSSPDHPIGEKQCQISELNLLFEIIQDEGASASTLCCQTVVALVKHGLLDFRFALNKFLNFIPTAKHGQAVVRGIADLLLLQVTVRQSLSPEKKTEPLYNLRSPPHPFISVFVSKSTLWPDILQEMSRLFRNTDSSLLTECWDMMKPFYIYVLQDPLSAGHTSHLKFFLVSELISICQHCNEMTDTVITFMVVESLPCLQLKSKMAIQESLTLLEMVVSWLLSSDASSQHHFLGAVTLDLLLISHKLSLLGEGLYPALTIIKKVSPYQNPGFLPDVTLLVIGDLLLKGCSLEEQSMLLQLAESALSWSTDQWFVSSMILPLLQILSHQKSQVTMETKLLSSNQKLAASIMSKISEMEQHEGKIDQNKKELEEQRIAILPHFCILQCCHQLLKSFRQPSSIYVWLTSLHQSLEQYPDNSLQVPEYILMLATALFIQSKHYEELCLQTLLDLVAKDNAKATSILTLFLYKLSQKNLSASLTKKLMYAIPDLAHHKFALAPVLKVIQSMAGTPALAAVGMRLAAKVWMKQERCFPQLQAMITRTDKVDKGAPAVYDEFLLARVATVRDICVARPHQHGAELIPTLSKILNDCTSPSEATAAALAMDALATLSEEEVVDVRTIWQVLEPKLSKDNRSKIQESICQLFSLVPELAVETEEYEEFRERVVTLLWQRSQHSSPQVVKAAYSALAQFDKEDFYLQDLPEQVVSEVKGQSEHASGKDEEGEEEEEAEDVPGSCFISLLKILPEAAQTGFEKLLSSLVLHEIASLPRHLNFTVTQKEAQSSSQADKFINTIPLLVYSKFESNKQPALKAPIAVSLLFCYEPKAEKGRDGRHGKRHLLSREQQYLNMLRILLNEIPSSYYFESPHLMSLSAAWVGFMGKVFQASLQAQLAQVETQENDGEEPSAAALTAWLHVRENLFEQVKNILRENSSAHPNCLLALAALAVVVTQHYLSLGKDTTNMTTLAPECVSQQIWIRQVVESLLVVVDKSYKREGRIFSWFQKGQRHQESGKQNSSVMAALGLSQIAPVLIAVDTELILRIMSVMNPLIRLKKDSTEGSKSDGSTMVLGVAVGLLLNGITEEKFVEVVGNEALTKVMQLLNHLEEAAFSEGETSYGAMLGLGEALSAMVSDVSVPVRSQITNIIQKLAQKLDEGVKSKEDLQISAYTFSLLVASSFNSNIIDAEETERSLLRLETLSQEHSGIATSLGFLCHSLCQAGHPKADDITMATIKTWTEILEKQKSSSVDKIDACNGLVAFVSGPVHAAKSSSTWNFKPKIQQEILQIIKKTKELLDSSDQRMTTSLVTWLGYSSFIRASSSQVRRAVPANYDYLPEESLLRACADFLQTAAQLGPEEIPAWQVETVFAALTGDGTNKLPPVNWAALIGPFLRLPLGARVQYRLIRLALTQCPSSHNASLFLSSWLSSSFLYNSLENQSKELLHVSLPVLAQHIPFTKLKDYLNMSLLPDLKGENAKVCVQIIRGLLGALRLPEPPPSIMSLLYEFTEKVYDCLPEEMLLDNDVIFRLLAECLVYLPPETIDIISHPAQEGNLVKSILLRSYLIGCGKQSLSWLEACIDVGMNLATEKDHNRLILALAKGLLQCCFSTSSFTRVTSRMQWLVEFIGHTHNVASGKTQLKEGRSVKEAAKFLLDLLCSVVAVWCSNQTPILVGVSPFNQIELPDDPTESLKMDDSESPSSCIKDEDVIVGRCVELLPESVLQLLDKQPWNQITEKMLQWLIAMYKLPDESVPLKYHIKIKATCQSLRHHAEFKKQIWTAVYSW